MPAHLRLEWLVFLLLAALVACGCESKEEIRSYTVEKENQPAAPRAAVSDSAAGDRMLGAIVPTGEQTWFFKVTGPMAAIDKNADKVNEFFQSIQVSAGADKPVWKTPDEWQEQGASGMRAATLKIPTDDKPLDLSVIPLPSSGAPNELLDNVNRWRGQLQLSPVDEQGLAADVKEAKAGDAKMWLVDLRGKASPGGMIAPFAGGGPVSGGSRPPGNAPVVDGAAGPNASTTLSDTRSTDLPPGHPPIGDEKPGNPTSAAPFKFAAPESWQQQPVSGMRKAAFIVQNGEKRAEITVIDLPASAPSIADPLQNVNRWRTEIGLAPIQADQLAGIVQKIEVDGKPSDYVELIPDTAQPAESQVGEATFAAAVPAGELIWFFKMRGDRDLVVAQRDNFKSFLKSIRFASDGGASDGDK